MVALAAVFLCARRVAVMKCDTVLAIRYHANTAYPRHLTPRYEMANTSSTNPTAQSTGSTGLAATLSPFAPTLQAIFRIGVGLLFMQHGVQKLFGGLGGDAVGSLFSMMGLAGVLEFFGGLLIVVGLFTRPVAIILSLEMVVAYFMAHQPQGGFPVQNGGELALMYALAFALLATIGAGPASIDARRGEG